FDLPRLLLLSVSLERLLTNFEFVSLGGALVLQRRDASDALGSSIGEGHGHIDHPGFLRLTRHRVTPGSTSHAHHFLRERETPPSRSQASRASREARRTRPIRRTPGISPRPIAA